MCNARPHLSLRLGAAAALPLLRRVVAPARVQPPCLLSLLLLKAVSERGARARITVTSKGVTCDTGRNLHIAVFFRFLSQSRVSVRVASSITLGAKKIETVNIPDLKTQFHFRKLELSIKVENMHTLCTWLPRRSTSRFTSTKTLTAARFPKPQSKNTQKSINSRMDEPWSIHTAGWDTVGRTCYSQGKHLHEYSQTRQGVRETLCERTYRTTPFTKRGKPVCAVRRDRGHPWDTVRLKVGTGGSGCWHLTWVLAIQYAQFLRINIGTLFCLYIYVSRKS